MRVIFLSILSFIILICLGISATSGTVAIWSDSETLEDSVSTGCLDLKVNGADDEPWGNGVGFCFDIPNAEVNVDYLSQVELWNPCDLDGIIYLNLKITEDQDYISQSIYLSILYNETPVTSGTIYDLAYQEILLGDLLANETSELTMVLRVSEGAPVNQLSFDTEFELVGPWTDTEHCSNTVNYQ